MKNKKKYIFSLVTAIILLFCIISVSVFILNDENKLTGEERSWINDNINTVQNVYVTKDKNVFSKSGVGVYYDLLNDFKEEYGLQINPITFSSAKDVTGAKFDVTTKLGKNDTLIYKDNYVILSNKNDIITNITNLSNAKVGVLLSNLDYVKTYLKTLNLDYVYFDNNEDLYKSLGTTVDYLIVPKMQDLDLILSKKLEIVYHLSDINEYYVYKSDNSILSNIFTKYIAKWNKEKEKKSFNKNELNIISTSLGMKETDIDKLLSVDYNYGFINNSPYEVIMSGKYGGIVSSYLQGFSELTNVKFNITKYNNYEKLVNNLNKGKVDIYFDYNTNIKSDFDTTSNGIESSISIITNKINNSSFNSVYGLVGKDVYVKEDSVLYSYLASIGNINIHTYKNNIELFSYNDEDKIIVLDKYIFDYYKNSKLDNYISKFESIIGKRYEFKINSDYEILSILFNKYIAITDPSSAINNGINLHEQVVTSGNLLNNIAKYTIVIIVILLILAYFVIKNSKKIRISRKVKKDDKMRFIDQLTSLKNRNYLSDFIKDWNNNTVYPQTILVVDLNKVQDINDKYGYDEGDKQIQACANVLIKTQIDNSEIMRSDGNEFVVYLVGYTQKQVINYIHKLNREFKKLPYAFGAEFGYSFIENDLKTIEDALNEATEEMKTQKESIKNGK